MIWAYAAVAAYQVVDGISKSRQAKKQAQRQREINEFNASLIEADAQETLKFGYTQGARYQSNIDAVLGNQKVAMASQGVDISQGTAAAIQEETKVTGFLNILDIERAARNKANQLKQQAKVVRMGGQVQYSQQMYDAQATQTAGFVNAANTMMTGYAKAK